MLLILRRFRSGFSCEVTWWCVCVLFAVVFCAEHCRRTGVQLAPAAMLAMRHTYVPIRGDSYVGSKSCWSVPRGPDGPVAMMDLGGQ